MASKSRKVFEMPWLLLERAACLLSALRTKLRVASFVVTVIGLIGAPAHLQNREILVVAACLLSVLIVGVPIAVDCGAGRIASVTMRLDGVDHTIARLPRAEYASS